MIQTVYGLHDYQPDNEDEISFKINEPITVIETDDEYMDGWWRGRNTSGKEGLFPRNYTTATLTNQNAVLPNQLSPSSDWQYVLPEKWNLEQVASWLNAKDMSSIATLFLEQEITGDILLQLDMDSLKELGITAFGKRYKLMQAINALLSIPENNDHSIPPRPISIKSNESSQHYQSRPSSQESTPTPTSSFIDTMYQNPRKAPIPPKQRSSFASYVNKQSLDLHRPLSPPNTVSTGISRCNTLTSQHTNSQDYSIRQSFSSHPSNMKYQSLPQPSSQQQLNDINLPVKLSSEFNPYPQTNIEYSDVPSQEGWLYKKSDKFNKRWNKRWFVLKNQHLYYFANPNHPKVKGIIYLNGYRIQSDPDLCPGKYCFKAIHEKERTYQFYIDDEQQMRSWLRSLMKATINRDYFTPVITSNSIATISLGQAQQLHPRPPSTLLSLKNDLYLQQHSHTTPLPSFNDSIMMTKSISSPLLTNHHHSMSSSLSTKKKSSSISKLEPLYQNEMENDEDLIDPLKHHDHLNTSMNHKIKNYQQFGLSPRPNMMIQTNHLSLSSSTSASPLSPTLSSTSSSYLQSLPSPPPIDSSTSTSSSSSELSSSELKKKKIESYISWIQPYLPKDHSHSSLTLDTFATSFRDGELLITLLEAISGKKMERTPNHRPQASSMSMIMLDNIVDVFKFMEQEGIPIAEHSFTIKDILHGVEEKIFLLLDTIQQWQLSYHSSSSLLKVIDDHLLSINHQHGNESLVY
ncbi:unnamed protein product [Cunninghamella blakesleeana]